MTHGGVGSITYSTGIFQGRNNAHIPINSAFGTIIALISLIAALSLLFWNFAGATITVNGVTQPATYLDSLPLRLILAVLFSIPFWQKIYSYTAIESKIPI